ncbi:MAG: hypothetical protein IK093_05470 [Ruminiclostridium sp.]|nr:hypothetical protein [Ruminiclostridium sp.]
MKKEMLSDEIGKIDPDLIEEAGKKRSEPAQPVRKKKPILIITSVLVAAAAAVTGVVVIPKLGLGNDIPVAQTEAAFTTTAAGTGVVTDAPVTGETTASGGETSAPEQEGGFIRERRRSDIVSDVSAVVPMGSDIAPDSDLRITLSKDVSEDELRERITLSPKSEFTLTRESDQSYLLSTGKGFGRGSLVKLAVSDNDGNVCDSWAFRTADKFAVASCYPAGSYVVSCDSGIEISFTSAPSPDAEDWFSITPRVDGTLSVVDRTLYFVPSEQFCPNASYTFTLAKGYPAENGETLEEDCTVMFRTSAYSDRGDYLFTSSSSSGFSESFLPEDRACVEIYCSDDLRNAEYETHLYRFGSTDDYLDAVKAVSEDPWGRVVDTAGLEDVFTSVEKPFVREDNNISAYVMLPEHLDEGCYIADISAVGKGDPGFSVQYLIQVSPISVFALSLGEENVFYVNDTTTGLPAAGANVTLETAEGKYTATVGEDGLAYMKTDGETGRAMLNIGAKTGRYIDSYILSNAKDVKYDDLYYMYLYTDREAYLPDDTVNVWGAVIPKVSGTELPEGLTLAFDGETQPVTLTESGTFTASFTFRNHTDSWWALIKLMDGDELMLSKGIAVHDYEKPTYIVDIDAPEYAIMPQYDAVPVTVDATYYEGTPAQGVMLECTGGIGDPGVLKTDSEGKASADVLVDSPYDTWKVSTDAISFEITGIENTYTYTEKRIPALYHDRMTEYVYDPEERSLTITANELDFSRADEFFDTVERGEWSFYGGNYELLRGASADIPVNVKVTRYSSEKVVTGSYYDYVEKRNVETYEYKHHQDVVGNYNINTENGVYTIADLPTDPELGYYYIEISAKDSRGGDIKESLWVENGRDYFTILGDDGSHWAYEKGLSKRYYRIEAVSGGTSMTADHTTVSTFRENEDITFRLSCSNGDSSFDGKLMLAVYNSDFVEYKIYDLDGGSDVKFTAGRECIPDVRYTGAYFDGRHVYKASGYYITFEPGERGIELEMKSDWKTYDAGDTAKVSVRAVDKNGNKLEGATVLLSVVDEAAFAIAQQNADPLGQLYRFVSYPAAESYISYIQHLSGSPSAGEMGGGGPASVRKDFKDTALFMTDITDSDGYASFRIELPDNLTTWRATAIAVYQEPDGALLAGKELLPIVVTRPVFITPIMHDSFVEGDDIAVSARCAGLGEDGVITVTISGGDIEETMDIRPQETANFGKLPVGDYTVLFTAENDEGSDSVERTLTVTETMLETYITKDVDLSDLSDAVKPTKYPLYAAFFNKEYMFSTDILYGLLQYGGSSLDARLASAIAAKELGFMTDEEIAESFGSETASGLAKLLPAAEESFDLTALICAAYPELASTATRTQFTGSLNGTSFGNVCASYMGLAALGEPVMNDVKKLLSAQDIPNRKSGLQLATALALCGDYNAAYDAYITFVPELTIDDSDPDAVKAYVKDSSGKESQEITRSALVAASLLNLPEAEYFARYLLDAEPKYGSCALELAIYVKSFVPEAKEGAAFTYKRGGETVEVTLDKHYPTLITFTEGQYAEADFEVQSGSIYVIADYTGRITENTEEPTLKINKKYIGSMAVGETVNVVISTEPYSIVYDVIPSCGRLDGSQGGQLITLYTGEDGKAAYKFTVSTAGEYVAESAVVYNYSEGKWGMSDRTTVTVGTADETA